jgi:hypothetical protein
MIDMRKLHVCARPGCPRLTVGRYCAQDSKVSTRNHCGIPRQLRGHGTDYDRRRRELLAGDPLCYWGCGRRATTADYAKPHSQGGTLAGLVASCGECNYARGAALTNSRNA